MKLTHEIDIVRLITKVLSRWKLLVLAIIAGAVIGAIIAINTPKKYTSTIVMAPEISGAGNMVANLSDLASMVGVDLSSGGNSLDAIYPEIYPDVISSSDFIVRLFDIKVTGNHAPSTYYDHLTKNVPVPFWSYPSIWIEALFAKKTVSQKQQLNIKHLTKEQDAVCNMIRGSVSCNVDKKTSVLTLSVTDRDPMIAATIVDTIQERLKAYIIMYRTKKARNDLAYTQRLFNEAKENYVRSRDSYGAYADANEDVVLASFAAKRDEMENNMQMKYNLYIQLNQQLQMAKAKVQERTPVFTVIQSASVPLKASSTPRKYIVLGYIAVFVLLDAVWLAILEDHLKKYINKRK